MTAGRPGGGGHPAVATRPVDWSAASLAARLRPWRRRILTVTAAWVLLVLAAFALDLAPAAPLMLAALVAIAGLGWFLADHAAANHLTLWPLRDSELRAGWRGNDFRVTSLATRLEAANTRHEGREALVHDLHVQLSTIIRERLYAKHGLVVEDEPKWSEGVMPTELWDFLVTLPPADLYRPERLDGILRRIETW